METKDYLGRPYEFYSATFRQSSDPAIYLITIYGVTEHGTTVMASYNFDTTETTILSALRKSGFRPGLEGARNIRDSDGDYDNLVLTTKPINVP